MAKLNLLPWREARRQQRKKEFFAQMGLVAAFGAALCFGAYMFMETQLELQNKRNARLKEEITKLEKQIQEIKDLDERKAGLLKRKEIIESLQGSRSTIVRLFDQLVRLIPDGVTLTGIKQAGNVVTLQGSAQSQARVSQYMRQLDTSPWLGNSDIKLITSVDAPEARRQRGIVPTRDALVTFELTVRLKEPTIDQGPEAAQTAAREAGSEQQAERAS